MHISPYEQGNIFNTDPLRERRLLVTKKEINKLVGLIKQQGVTLVPLKLYFKGKWAKLSIGIGKGKKLYDKRQDIAKKSAQKEIAKECPSCHNIVAFKANFCPDCGTKLFDKNKIIICKHCGKINLLHNHNL